VAQADFVDNIGITTSQVGDDEVRILEKALD